MNFASAANHGKSGRSSFTADVLKITATYIGTVVGAGFASGQSILQFFTVNGYLGLVGIVVSTALFSWLGTKMMVLSHRIKAFSYQEFNIYLFGPHVGKAANVLTFVILFGVTAVMLSGTGSIFEERLGLPYQLGIIVSLVLGYLVMTGDMKGVVAANSLVVPLMIGFLALVAVFAVGADGLFPSVAWRLAEWHDPRWMLNPFTYAALNMAFVQSVLVPLGGEAKNESVLKWGGCWGGIGLGIMLVISHLAMQDRMPGILQYDIPMAEIIQDLGWWVHLLFLLVIYGEIFTTLIGNVFGISRQLQSLWKLPGNLVVAAVLAAGYFISQVGFSSLLSYLYPFFGYLGIILLIWLAVKKMPAG